MSSRGKRGGADLGPTLFDLGEPVEAPKRKPKSPPVDLGGGLVRVAFNRPLLSELTYGVPSELGGTVAPGVRVEAPLGRRREIGVVVDCPESTDVPRKRLRSIHRVLDESPVVEAELLGLTRWMAERYACSWGEALALILPAPLKRAKGARKVNFIRAHESVGPEELASLEESQPKQYRLLRTLLDMGGDIEMREFLRQLQLSDSPARTLERRGWVVIESKEERPKEFEGERSNRPAPDSLTPDQRLALARIESALVAREHRAFLLEGVTGSGKTEVYLAAIKRALEDGRGAIVLVPEIALTPQTVGWFRARFDEVAVVHSRMTDRQRFDTWRRVREGRARVVVGARSALFAPVANLGVIVVDEEHEPSFKQSNIPRYHARDVAVERARRASAVCILGSATPSMESYRRARETRELDLLRLPRRISKAEPLRVQIVDLKEERSASGGPPLFSRLLREQLTVVRSKKEQAILFLNRRGFVPVLWCSACKETIQCANCDVSMTWHRGIGRLVCHSCCDERPRPAACPTCSKPGLAPFGFGSERVESALLEIEPDLRVARMDSDTMRRQEDYETTLAAFGRGEIDVLVGTQMIAKGLDFPRVTLVGVLSADQGLWLPDFRAAERTYQLIAQVAGRAGRAELPGTIVIQTYRPDHPAVRLAAKGAFDEFAKLELADRAELGYPPFGRLVRVLFEDEHESKVIETSNAFASELRELSPELLVLGPTPAPIARLRNRFRRHFLIKVPPEHEASTSRALLRLRTLASKLSRPRIAIDVDPMSVL